MPQPSFRSPFHEPYLRYQLRLHPLHLPHLVSGHAAAPAGRLRVRQVDEWTWCGFSALKTSRRRLGNEAGPHLAREPQARVVVVADQQRVDAVRPWAVAADHELLLVLQLQLLPGVAPLPGLVHESLRFATTPSSPRPRTASTIAGTVPGNSCEGSRPEPSSTRASRVLRFSSGSAVRSSPS